MSIRDLLRPRPELLPRRTIRLRLTVLYASLFLASGAALLAFTYVLVREATGGVLVGTGSDGSTFVINERQAAKPQQGAKAEFKGQRSGAPGKRLTVPQQKAQLERDRAVAQHQHDAQMHQLLEQSGIALALMAAVSILLGWLAAGRVLRPLRTLNERARTISATSLHRRLELTGPDDELKQLADTFDELLGRLEASFAAQRQFVANASHELRTPLARAQTLAEVALADPEATVDSLRASHRRVLAAGHQQERLIEALLTLARSERGLEQRDRFDLAALGEAVLANRRPEAERRGLDLHARLEPAETSGASRLAERLIANLVDNALRHNHAPGRVEVTTTTTASRAVLSVANSGPIVPPDEVEGLFQPFQRFGADRTDHGEGIGLGLSIVKAIADAHGASITARARPHGGLLIEVAFLSVEADGRQAGTSREPTSSRRAFLRRRHRAPASGAPATEVAPIR